MARSRGKQAAQPQPEHTIGELEHSLVEQLSLALNDSGNTDPALNAIDDRLLQPNLQSQGQDVQAGGSGNGPQREVGDDDQMLLESLNQIIGNSGLVEQQPQQQQHMRSRALDSGDGESMQDALNLARLLIQQNGSAGAADETYSGLHTSSNIDPAFGLGGDLALPPALDGPADAATLKAVQNILQELGSAWEEPKSQPKSSRSRQRHGEPLTSVDRERIRLRDRMRKQKWRDTNSSRNKDHDLRSRIMKRALEKFGPGESTEKQSWIENEFSSRRERRSIRENSHSRRPRAVALASELRDLFAKSNAVMQGPWRQFTEGLIPRHLVRAFMIPSPPRPGLNACYKPRPLRTTIASHVPKTAETVSMGFPPNLLRLARRDDDIAIKLEDA